MNNKVLISDDELIKRLRDLKDQNAKIHITINDHRKKVINAESTISEIYQHFICVEAFVQHYLESFTIKLVDLKIGRVKIQELSI